MYDSYEDRFRSTMLFALMFGPMAAINAVLPIAIQSPGSQYFAVLLAGMMCGQFGLLVIWGAVGPHRLWFRTLIAVSLGVIMYNAFVMGLGLAEGGGRSVQELVRFNLVIPLYYLALVFPFWLGKIGVGLRITDRGRAAEEPQQFGILQVMIGMTLFGAAISLTRFAFRESSGGEAWAAVLVSAMMACGLAVMIGYPCLLATMLPRHTRTTIAALLGYAGAIFGLIFGIFAIFTGMTLEPYLVVTLFAVGACGVLMGGLIVLRLAGFSLLMRVGDAVVQDEGTTPFSTLGRQWETVDLYREWQSADLYRGEDNEGRAAGADAATAAGGDSPFSHEEPDSAVKTNADDDDANVAPKAKPHPLDEPESTTSE